MLNVKNTMSGWLVGLIAPHYCISCGEIGAILCECCRNNIAEEPYERCLVCARLSASTSLCENCRGDYVRAWCVGERNDILKRLIDDYKFKRMRAAYRPLAELISDALPMLPRSIVVTSVPTIAPHIRQRGYDHACLVAKELARLKDLPYQALLLRKTSDVQLGATKAQRRKQAANAFSALRGAMPDTVLLIDDVFTTGSTVCYAAKALRDAGVREVWVAVVARQRLD